MKKIIVALSLAAVFVPFAAFASPTNTIPGCTIPPDHGISSEDGTKWTGCITAAAWDAAMAAQQHGVNLPIFMYPAVVTDKYGITYPCEAFLTHGCVDATKTPEYDSYIRSLGIDLVQRGYHAGDFGGRFDGVMAAVR